MATSTSLPLRILYTINASPQYILARSSTSVPVELIRSTYADSAVHDDDGHVYASASLKNCLHTICKSSPELLQDSSRDFSVYVLDPLESNSAPAPVHISDKSADSVSQNPRGVAVGFGLMSWALNSDDESVRAVGTIVRGAVSESLEVVFALRETITKPPPSWGAAYTESSHLHSSARRTTSSSQTFANTSSHASSSTIYHPRKSSQNIASSSTHASAATQESKVRLKARKVVPVTDSDQMLQDPHTYTGPQRGKRGRPKASKVTSTSTTASRTQSGHPAPSTHEVIDCDAPNTIALRRQTSASAHTHAGPISEPQSVMTAPEKALEPAPVDAGVKTEAADDSHILSVLQHLTGGAQASATHTSIVLAALNSIDSSSHTSNPALIAALRQLLAIYANPTPAVPVAATPALPQSHSLPTPPSQPLSLPAAHDDEIVILDKENLNPAAFTRRNQRELSESKLNVPSGPTPGTQPPRPPQGLSISSKFNGISPPRVPSSSTAPPPAAIHVPTTLGKRTLSDFMDEQENSKKSRAKSKGRPEKSNESRRTSFRQAKPVAPADAYRHYRLDEELPRSDSHESYYRKPGQAISAPWTSPVRPPAAADPYLADSETKVEGTSTALPRSSPARPQRVAASSPIREPHLPRKKYTVPAWAITDTALQPRLSEDAQRVAQEAEEKRRRERRERQEVRRKSQNAVERARRRQAKENSENVATSTVSVQRITSTTTSTTTIATTTSTSASRALPIAAVNISPLGTIFSSPRRRSLSPSPSRPSYVPQTPTRQRRTMLPGSVLHGDSLFTPASRTGGGSILGTGSSLFGSARTMRLSPQSGYGPSGSPLNRKKGRASPRSPPQSPLKPKALFRSPDSALRLTAQATGAVDKTDEDAQRKRDLETAFDDLGTPDSALPVASDVEPDEIILSQQTNGGDARTPVGTEGDDDDNNVAVNARKEIWEGLPPSSPPPPSSPALLPELSSDVNDDEDMEDLQLPVATSDMEATESEFDDDAAAGFSSVTELGYSSGDASGYVTEEGDFSAYFSIDEHGGPHEAPVDSDDIFAQFTNLSGLSDPHSGSSSDAVDGFALGGIDLDGFWDAFNPLLQGAVVGDTNAATGSETKGGLMNEEADTDAIAREVHALLSGCVV